MPSRPPTAMPTGDPRSPRRGLRRALIVAWGLSLLIPVRASAALRIVSVERWPGNRLSLVFHEEGAGPLDYRLTWQPQPGEGVGDYLDLEAGIVDLGAGYYQAFIPSPPHSPRFYRIAGFAGPDTDGDGLSDALEDLVGTSPDTFDTDEDGFGDGVELAHEGDPLDQDVEPWIVQTAFALTDSSANEGDGFVTLEVTFSDPFNGTLLYEIADMSTAVPGEDFAPVSGTIGVNGVGVLIPIALLDDSDIEPLESLVVDLVEDPWGDYRVGGASRHMVRLYDNDAYWSGVMGTESSAQLGFRLRMVRVGDDVSAALVSELSPEISQGVGTIPVGTWPVTATLTHDSFDAVAGPIPMGSSLLTGDTELQRWLTFTADAANSNHTVRANVILGEFTDRLEAVDPAMGWIGGEVTGVVALMEDLPTPAQAPDPTGSPDAGGAQAEGGAQ